MAPNDTTISVVGDALNWHRAGFSNDDDARTKAVAQAFWGETAGLDASSCTERLGEPRQFIVRGDRVQRRSKVDATTAMAKAQLSLEGLSVGDAFGELFFSISPHASPALKLPPGPWPWTDDTHMALSIVETLKTYGRIEQDALAQAFARRYMEEPHRGYAGGAARLLRQIASGADWRQVSSPV